MIYDTPIDSIEKLKRVKGARVNSVSQKTFQTVWENTKSHLNYIMQHDGDRIESFLSLYNLYALLIIWVEESFRNLLKPSLIEQIRFKLLLGHSIDKIVFA